MKLIKPSIKLLKQEKGLEGVYKQIEHAGRTCYASEPKEGVTSEQFVHRLINSGHGSVLEHGTIYLKLPIEVDSHSNIVSECKYKNNKYSKVNEYLWDYYVTTNLRVLIENNWMKDLQYICEPTEYHERRITVEVICDIGITREFNRHRTFSISEQSSRYCNFSKDKFGNEITFIEPCWPLDSYEGNLFKMSLLKSETHYMRLIQNGWKPQQARNILPLATATKVVYTAFKSDWEHFFELRCSSNAHPQAQEISNLIVKEFQNLKDI